MKFRARSRACTCKNIKFFEKDTPKLISLQKRQNILSKDKTINVKNNQQSTKTIINANA